MEFFRFFPSQNTNVYKMVVQCSQIFANIKHSITVFNEHLFDVCEDSSKCEKRLCLAGKGAHRVSLEGEESKAVKCDSGNINLFTPSLQFRESLWHLNAIIKTSREPMELVWKGRKVKL